MYNSKIEMFERKVNNLIEVYRNLPNVAYRDLYYACDGGSPYRLSYELQDLKYKYPKDTRLLELETKINSMSIWNPVLGLLSNVVGTDYHAYANYLTDMQSGADKNSMTYFSSLITCLILDNTYGTKTDVTSINPTVDYATQLYTPQIDRIKTLLKKGYLNNKFIISEIVKRFNLTDYQILALPDSSHLTSILGVYMIYDDNNTYYLEMGLSSDELVNLCTEYFRCNYKRFTNSHLFLLQTNLDSVLRLASEIHNMQTL